MRNTLSFLPEALGVFCKYNICQPLARRPFLPRAMHMIPTHRCNAKCVMCGIWKEKSSADKELSTSDFDRLFSDRLFSRLEYAGISGGEPFLRKDLFDIISLLKTRCPALKRISITTNGMLTDRIEPALSKIVNAFERNGLLLDISISFHGLGEMLSRIYGVEGAFDRISRTIDLLTAYRQKGKLSFSLNCVLLRENLETAPAILNWAQERSIPISFVLGEQRDRFFNDQMQDVFIGEEQREVLLRFLRELGNRGSRLNPGRIKYEELTEMLEGRTERSLSCYYAFSGFLVGYDGTLYYCSHSRAIGNCLVRSAYELFYDPENLMYRRSELIQKECRKCPPYTRTRLEIEKDLLTIARYSLKY